MIDTVRDFILYLKLCNRTDRLLSFSTDLKEAYGVFQLLTYHFRNKDPDSFFDLLKNLPTTLDPLFKQKIENLINYEEGIRNA
ncbi:TPA: transposase [Streptococcus agalactiae]|nr:transposase [Streptococcus agalactiae]